MTKFMNKTFTVPFHSQMEETCKGCGNQPSGRAYYQIGEELYCYVCYKKEQAKAKEQKETTL